MKSAVVVAALCAFSAAHADLVRPTLTQTPLVPKLHLDLDSVFERAMGAAHVGLTDGKVKFLRVRRGQREDVAAMLGRGVRVMPVVDLSFSAASLLTRFIF
jgi:hypothetical protein